MRHHLAEQHASGDAAMPLFRSYWRATLDMLPYLWRNPGVGVNAGTVHLPLSEVAGTLDFATEIRIDAVHGADTRSGPHPLAQQPHRAFQA